MSAEKQPADAPVSELRSVPLKKRLVWGAIVGLAIGAGVYGLSFLEILQKYEWRTLDWRQQMMARPTEATKKVVLVLVDEFSVREMRRKDKEDVPFFPWPRDIYAYLATVLKEKGKAAAIVFDILFTDPWPEGGHDKQFAETTKSVGNVIHAAKLETTPEGNTPIFGKAEKDAVEKARVAAEGWTHAAYAGLDAIAAPIPGLTEGAKAVGLVNVVRDPDGVLRRADLLTSFPDSSSPLASLGLQGARVQLGVGPSAAMQGRELKVGDRMAPLDGDSHLLLRYYGGPATFQTESAVTVLRSGLRVDEGKTSLVDFASFEGKVVIVGYHLAGYEDVHPSPMSDAFPGPEFHATVCANILGGDSLRELGGLGRILVLSCVGLVGGVVAFAVWKPVPAAFVTALLAAAHLGIALLAFQRGTVIEVFFPGAALGGIFVAAMLSGYLTEGRAKRDVSRAFKQYLSPVVVREVMKDPTALKLGGETREVAVYFSDIAGFSTFSEGMEPPQLVSFLNVYLTAMSDVIMERRGVVDKYIGDAIMAFWGAPVTVEAPGREACLAVLEQWQVMVGLNQRFQAQGLPEIRFRVGLNLGPVVVGNMGSSQRFNYTLMGDEVNLASRLEGANKFFGTGVLLTDSVRRSAGDAVVTRRLGKVQVVGKSVPADLYTLVGRPAELPDKDRRWLERYHEALGLLERGDKSATPLFESLHAEREDKVVDMCLKKCREVEETGKAWDGIWVLKEKG